MESPMIQWSLSRDPMITVPWSSDHYNLIQWSLSHDTVITIPLPVITALCSNANGGIRSESETKISPPLAAAGLLGPDLVPHFFA